MVVTLGYSQYREALRTRAIKEDRDFDGRENYIGASEIGGCQRILAFRKALRLPFLADADKAGIFAPAKVAEDEFVAILHHMGLEGCLHATGKGQIELSNGPLRCHPDGIFRPGAFEPCPCSAFYASGFGATPYSPEEVKAILKGPGILEIKSASSAMFSNFIKRGLSEQYLDQCQTAMALATCDWTLLLLGARDNYSKVSFWLIPAEPLRFLDIQIRAEKTMTSIRECRDLLALHEISVTGEESMEDSGIQGILYDLLPAPDLDRGYCHECPLWRTCPSFNHRAEGAAFPEDVILEVQAYSEELRVKSDIAKAAKEDADMARSMLLDMSERYSASKALLGGNLKSLSISKQKARTTINAKKLEEMFPEAYAACMTMGESSTTVKVTERK